MPGNLQTLHVSSRGSCFRVDGVKLGNGFLVKSEMRKIDLLVVEVFLLLYLFTQDARLGFPNALDSLLALLFGIEADIGDFFRVVISNERSDNALETLVLLA